MYVAFIIMCLLSKYAVLILASLKILSVFFLLLLKIQLIYNVVFVSGLQQSDWAIHTHTHTFFSRFFSMIGYYKILNIVPCAIQ